MPARPQWLLAIPDAIRQLEALDRELLTRRDWAAQLMHTFGADLTGYARTLPRTRLLRLLRTYRSGSAFRGEEQRREHLMTELRKARLTRIRVTVPAEALEGRLSDLPSGVVVERDRIEVRYAGATEAVAKLMALAQARRATTSASKRS